MLKYLDELAHIVCLERSASGHTDIRHPSTPFLALRVREVYIAPFWFVPLFATFNVFSTERVVLSFFLFSPFVLVEG